MSRCFQVFGTILGAFINYAVMISVVRERRDLLLGQGELPHASVSRRHLSSDVLSPPRQETMSGRVPPSRAFERRRSLGRSRPLFTASDQEATGGESILRSHPQEYLTSFSALSGCLSDSPLVRLGLAVVYRTSG